MTIMEHVKDKRALAKMLFPDGKESLSKNRITVGNISGEPGQSTIISSDTGKFYDFNGQIKGDLVDILKDRLRTDDKGVVAWLKQGDWLVEGYATSANGRSAPSQRSAAPAQRTQPAKPKQLHPAPIDAPIPTEAEVLELAGRTEWPCFEDVPNPVSATIHVYRQADRRAVMVVVRFVLENGKKAMRRMGWYGAKDGWKPGKTAERGPVPLYGLLQLLKHPHEPVLVVEGEKCVKAASEMDLGRIPACPLGGSSPNEHTDWTPLRGRDVVIWPDNDPVGSTFAQKVHEAATAAGAARIAIISPEEFWQKLGGSGAPPKGWDVASPMPTRESDGPSDATAVGPEEAPAPSAEASEEIDDTATCYICEMPFYPEDGESKCGACS